MGLQRVGHDWATERQQQHYLEMEKWEHWPVSLIEWSVNLVKEKHWAAMLQKIMNNLGFIRAVRSFLWHFIKTPPFFTLLILLHYSSVRGMRTYNFSLYNTFFSLFNYMNCFILQDSSQVPFILALWDIFKLLYTVDNIYLLLYGHTYESIYPPQVDILMSRTFQFLYHYIPLNCSKVFYKIAWLIHWITPFW